MNKLLLAVAVVLIVAHAFQLRAETPVVIELFTSEGCSSCPPADALLVELNHKSPPNGVKLILMGEHVDYWNYIGWKDRFSSAQFSERQDAYARHFNLKSVYTPQMVIDGRQELVGNSAAEVYGDISKAASESKPAQVSLKWEQQPKLHVAVQGPAGERSKVLLAITEDGLSTEIKSGENGGRTLQHAAVVRLLKEIGTLSNGQFETSISLPVHSDWKPDNLKVVVLVQQPGSGKILGADAIDY